MLMLSNAKPVTRNQLHDIPTPAATRTWKPVPHSAVVEQILGAADKLGFRLASESYAVLNGTLWDGEEKIPVPNARLFGSLDFEAHPDLPAGMRPSIGLRNAHDKSYNLSVLSGARVMVCANGMLCAEYVVGHKHTAGLNLTRQVELAMSSFQRSIEATTSLQRSLTEKPLELSEARSWVVTLAQHGAFSSSQILDVVKEYEEPRHEEFSDRNAWSLYNAATQVMKKQSPPRQTAGFRALNDVMRAAAA